MISLTSTTMDFKIAKHLAAISPYSKILQQPPVPSSRMVDSAVYLFRHGIIHVNGHDYHQAIAPFLQKLRKLQQDQVDFGTGKLAFLSTYSSWITEDDVGQVSTAGLDQSLNMGRAFRTRYGDWLDSKEVDPDSAQRCEQSARAFQEGFTGNLPMRPWMYIWLMRCI